MLEIFIIILDRKTKIPALCGYFSLKLKSTIRKNKKNSNSTNLAKKWCIIEEDIYGESVPVPNSPPTKKEKIQKL